MDWRTWLADQGIRIPATPDVEAVSITLIVVVGAYGVGWLAGLRAAPLLLRLVRHWIGVSDRLSEHRLRSIVHHGVSALCLLIAGKALPLTPIALIVFAVALGHVVAMLSYRGAAIAGLNKVAALVVAALAFIATAAAKLGGFVPLIELLENIGVTVGSRRITLLGIVNFALVAVLLLFAARIANRVLTRSIGRLTKLDISQRVLIEKLAGIGVIVLAVLLGIDLLGIDLTALAVFSGALGLAVGFGLQKTLGNLIAGLILLMDRSVKPGDVIVVGETFGAITKIGIRAVSVVTRDGKEHLIPNEQLMTEEVENWSYSSRNVRVHIPVGVSYNADLALAQKLMIEAAVASPRVLTDPKPNVWLKEFGDSSVDHDILVWIADPEAGVGNVRSDVLNRVWVLFKDNAIEIPFPQRDLHIRSMPEGASMGDDSVKS